jgi:hypothetical protein
MPKKTYTQINSVTLAASASSVTFSSIPQNFRDLVLVIDAKASGNYAFLGRFNGDTGTNYSRVRVGGTGSTTYSTVDTANHFRLTSSTTDVDGMRIAQIMDYSATDKHKTVLVRDSVAGNNVAATANRWANTVAVTSVSATVDLGGTFLSGATFTLYGIEA